MLPEDGEKMSGYVNNGNDAQGLEESPFPNILKAFFIAAIATL
jgi:hypothetical protein